MIDPNPEKLKEFYDWLRSEMDSSRQYYNEGGQKVARNFWMLPPVRAILERQMRDMELIDKSNDFPWTYCKLCGAYYPCSMNPIDNMPLCGNCFLEFRNKK